jgi:hypothetical protein
MRGNPLYESADLYQPGVTHRVDIAQVPLTDGGYDMVIAYHVLRSGGVAVLSVPINATRQQTYENAAVTTPEQRHGHFSAEDIIDIAGSTSPSDWPRRAFAPP